MRLINYIKETKAELKHVNWPTRKQSMVFTVIVIIISLAVSVYLGLFDYALTKLLGIVV